MNQIKFVQLFQKWNIRADSQTDLIIFTNLKYFTQFPVISEVWILLVSPMEHKSAKKDVQTTE